MPRGSRLNIQGGLYHLIARGIERRDIFKCEKDRENFLERLGLSLKNTGTKCYAWVLMSNHIHLLIKLGAKTLSNLMSGLLTGYAGYFNRKYHRSGHLFQNRFKSILCQEDAYLKKLVAYIHLNPYRARVVENLTELEKYKWCGHGALCGQSPRFWHIVNDVLSYFGETERSARKSYKEFVELNMDRNWTDELMGGGLLRSIGGQKFVEKLTWSKQMQRADERILGNGAFVDEMLKKSDETAKDTTTNRTHLWDIDKLISRICAMLSVKKNDILKKGRNNKSIARSLICYYGSDMLGIKGVDLSRLFKISGAAVTRHIKAGEYIVNNKGIKLIS